MALLDPHAVAIGRAVRAAIATAGLNQAKFAEASGLTTRSLSRRINGQLPFTWPELVKVAEITGTTLPELVAAAERAYERCAA